MLPVIFLLVFTTLLTVGQAIIFGFGDIRPPQRTFEVYWNVPTFMCHKYGLYFEEVSRDFGILQNSKDDFRGDQIAILYDPGMFPAILQDENGHKTLRNGGVPQQGNLAKHLDVFRKHLTDQIPDEHFQGLGVIDFESWRPIFRQNWASLQPYRNMSMLIVKNEHPDWDARKVENRAKQDFEKAGKIFMQETLKLAKELRPRAKWSYYAYPYCFNLTPNQPGTFCSRKVMGENDSLSWLFDIEDVLLPSIYLRAKLMPKERVGMARGRVTESLRVSRDRSHHPKTLPYYWFKYQDDSDVYLTKEDLVSTIQEIRTLGAGGLVIWGSSQDVNTRAKCHDLLTYTNDTLGPIIRKIAQATIN